REGGREIGPEPAIRSKFSSLQTLEYRRRSAGPILVNREKGMAAKPDRAAILSRLRMEIEDGHAIYDALCGSGITAKMAGPGGASIAPRLALAISGSRG